jgi:hypothetical protein
MAKSTIQTTDPRSALRTKSNANADELYAGYYIQVPLTAPGGTLNAGDILYVDCPFAGAITAFRVKAQTAPTSSAATFDLKRAADWGGSPSSILTSSLSLAAASFEAADTSIGTPTVTAGDMLAVEVVSADSGATCADAIAIIHITRD